MKTPYCRFQVPPLWIVLMLALLTFPAEAGVRLWTEDTSIPTYLAGDPDPNPMFYFGKASQGAEGRVYPYPLYDSLTHQKVNKTYKIVYLENEYIRIGIMPEIGGRIFEGVDKSNGYNFFYRQHVIKPALIGLIGAWISGGVEWNIPHHHRATTFIPVQWRTEEKPDGSKTIWVGELELRHRMRWAVGYTLRPGKSYLEASLRIVNRTPVVNSMLCFANVAVHVDENYQVIFPPRTQYVTHHHKREFTTWPIATGRYGGYNFGKGIDASWFKNHDSANSMFAWNYEDDFLAGYDHGKKAGLMSVADHHIVPGKKLWTWGNGPRGRMWDKILTDEDGPYIELMVGAYSDNQPDYSWLQPFEVKSFEMYWYPFLEIGGVKQANLEAAVNLEVDKEIKVGFCTTSAHRSAVVALKARDHVLLNETVAIHPGKAYLKTLALPKNVQETDLKATLSVNGKELISYSPTRIEAEPMPKPVAAPASPVDIKTNEELYLTGLRIEQFHNPNLDPEPYWNEALKRDPFDSRVLTAMGTKAFKRAQFKEAESYFRKALERLTDKFTSPKDGEAIYYLALALKAQDKTQEAFKWFYQSTWSAAWKGAGYFSLAELTASKCEWSESLKFLNCALQANSADIRTLNLKAAVLRHMGQTKEALKLMAEAFQTDPLDVRAMAERWLITKQPTDAQTMVMAMEQHPATVLETAAEFLNAGLWEDGTEVLLKLTKQTANKSTLSPLVFYYLAFFADQLGKKQEAKEFGVTAEALSPQYAFPFQHEMIPVLLRAMERNPRDARAPYYLGNLLFDWQSEEAIKLWEKSISLDSSFAIALRNLAVAYSHQPKGNALSKAVEFLEKAVASPGKYPTHFAELDELYEAAGKTPEVRLAMLESNHAYVSKHDAALSREIGLKLFMSKYEEAIQLMTGRQFTVWEGGTLSISDYWVDAHILRGYEHFVAKRYAEALTDYQLAATIPDNLPSENRGANLKASEIAYRMGEAYEAKGEGDKAKTQWTKASERSGRDRGSAPDDRGIQSFFRAQALIKLEKTSEANAIFTNLVNNAKQTLEKDTTIDFFASFGTQQSQRSRLAMAHLSAGLGYLGQGNPTKAAHELNEALKASPDLLSAKVFLKRNLRP